MLCPCVKPGWLMPEYIRKTCHSFSTFIDNWQYKPIFLQKMIYCHMLFHWCKELPCFVDNPETSRCAPSVLCRWWLWRCFCWWFVSVADTTVICLTLVIADLCADLIRTTSSGTAALSQSGWVSVLFAHQLAPLTNLLERLSSLLCWHRVEICYHTLYDHKNTFSCFICTNWVIRVVDVM